MGNNFIKPVGVRRIALFLPSICLIFLLLPYASSSNDIEPPNNKIDPAILEELKTKEEVIVVINLKTFPEHNTETIIEKQSREDKIHEFRKIISLSNEQSDRILDTIPRDEFRLRYKFSGGFSGWATSEGVSALSENPAIAVIELAKHYYPELRRSRKVIKVRDVEKNYPNLDGSGKKICIVDSGVDEDHPALEDNIVDKACWCLTVGGAPCCPDGSSQQDDRAPDNDLSSHGSQMAGIAAGNGNGRVKGVAPGAGLLIAKVFDQDYGGYADGNIRSAIDWCLSEGADVISLSFGSPDFQTKNSCDNPDNHQYHDILDTAYGMDVFVVAAAGNEKAYDGIADPACHSKVTSVGATRSSLGWLDGVDSIVPKSNRAENMDLLAPGCRISSADRFGSRTTGCGTSASAPHVAGAAALMLQRDPELKPFEIKIILQGTGLPITDEESKLTFRRIDVLAAIKSLRQYTAIPLQSCGDAPLSISDTTTDFPWLGLNTSYELDPGESVNITASTLSSMLAFDNYQGEINILSNALDNTTITVPFSIAKFDGQGLLDRHKGVLLTEKNRQSGAQGIYQSKLFVDQDETENLEILFNLLTDDTVSYTVTLPNGTNITGSSVASDPNSTIFENPQNGTWTITLSTASNDDVEFQLVTTPFPSDNPIPGVNFSDTRMGYIDACVAQDTSGLRILMQATASLLTPPLMTTMAMLTLQRLPSKEHMMLFRATLTSH
jgi:subtilisin family serine protease